MKSIKDLIAEFGKETWLDEDLTINKLISHLSQDYNDLISLRNKLEYDIEDERIYQEDIQTLDHILDEFELFFDLLGIELESENKQKKRHLYYKLGVELLDNETQQPIEHIEYEEIEDYDTAAELYKSWNIEENRTAKYIYQVRPSKAILVASKGYKTKKEKRNNE